jgi:hypothetical protein
MRIWECSAAVGKVTVTVRTLPHASTRAISLTKPVLTSSHTFQLSRPPLLTIQPTLHRPFGVQVFLASTTGYGKAKQRSEPTQTRASALAIAAVIIASVSSLGICGALGTLNLFPIPLQTGLLPLPVLRRHPAETVLFALAGLFDR